jgi:hypothetical protein
MKAKGLSNQVRKLALHLSGPLGPSYLPTYPFRLILGILGLSTRSTMTLAKTAAIQSTKHAARVKCVLASALDLARRLDSS